MHFIVYQTFFDKLNLIFNYILQCFLQFFSFRKICLLSSSLSCNQLISLLIFSIPLFWLVFGIFTLCTYKNVFYTKAVNFFYTFCRYHGKIFWVFLCILFMTIIMCIYVYIVMCDYLCIYVVMCDYF